MNDIIRLVGPKWKKSIKNIYYKHEFYLLNNPKREMKEILF